MLPLIHLHCLEEVCIHFVTLQCDVHVYHCVHFYINSLFLIAEFSRKSYFVSSQIWLYGCEHHIHSGESFKGEHIKSA